MLRVGCQTYTWEMLGDKWSGRVDDMLTAIADSGYEGIEITNTMIREYAERPVEFGRALKARDVALGLGVPVGKLQAKRGWLGVDSVSAADGRRVLEFFGAAPHCG